MGYNWPEIFENKTEKELYSIYAGETTLSGEPQKYAEAELKRRGFNFNDLTDFRKRNQLNNLVEEADARIFFDRSSRRHRVNRNLALIASLIFALLFIFISTGNTDSEKFGYALFIVSVLNIFMAVISHILYKYELKRETELNEKISKLKNELSAE